MTVWTRPARVRTGLLAACCTCAAAFGLAGSSPAADPTEYKNPTRTGTERADRITGTRKRDVIYAVDGNDRVDARAGNDIVYGGSGHDRLRGGSGNDLIEGGSGNDRLYGDKGRDDLDGGSGNDRIYARDGVRDKIFCGSGNDRVIADKKDLIRGQCESVSRR